MNPDRVKATDLLVESIKSILTLSTASIAALLGYIGVVGGGAFSKWNILALSCLFIASITSILNINALVNKVYRGEDKAIRSKDVKALNWILSMALIAGLMFSAVYIFSYKPQRAKPATADDHLYFKSGSLEVPSDPMRSIRKA